MTDAKETPLVQPASRELTDLAVTMRPDWDRDDLSGALVAAKTAGWSWERTFREVSRLLLLDDGEPAALRHAAATPLRPSLAPSGDASGWAARARQMLAGRDDDAGAA